jgi:hypothetical protein
VQGTPVAASAPAALATVTSPGEREPAAPLHADVLRLQRTAGNRATARAVRALQRDAVKTGYQWPTDPKTVNSPFPLRVLIGWLQLNKVTERPLEDESAYDRSKVEPDPLGCLWNGVKSNVRAVADAFMKESAANGYSFRREDVVATIRDQLARRKHERTPDILFMPRSAWDAKGDKWDAFPWFAYADDTDQFWSDAPDPMKGPAGPIVDWLEWYQFDAPWPTPADQDAVMIEAQGGERTGRVLGVVRLYCNDAIRAGFLGVDRTVVESFVRRELQSRKERKQAGNLVRKYEWDGRGIKDEARAIAFGSTPKVTSKQPDSDVQQTVGAQWTWTAGKRKPDRTVQIQFQKGAMIIQGSVNVDTGAVQWLAGVQPTASTPEIRILGAMVSAQAFLQVLAGVTVDGSASGTFTIQAAAGLQVTIKWGPITVQLQAGPQLAWDPTNGWQHQFSVSPAGGPSSPIPGDLTPAPPGGMPAPPPVLSIFGRF